MEAKQKKRGEDAREDVNVLTRRFFCLDGESPAASSESEGLDLNVWTFSRVQEVS